MKDFSSISLADARRDYLASSTTAMPIGGLIAWGGLAVVAFILGKAMPAWVPLTVAALPFPIALLIDKLRGEPGMRAENRHNPITQLFMRFITVIALLIPFIILAAKASASLDILVLGLAILAGMMWVPHGWGADDPAGFIHFAVRCVLCYAAYLLAPEALRTAAIAGAAALTYVYAIWAMKKPASAR
jgi:hypothetical protein